MRRWPEFIDLIVMSIKTITNQAIALAGIAQASALVEQLATTGQADSTAMNASIGSLLKLDAPNVADIFGGLQGVSPGLQRLQEQLSGQSIVYPDQARYAASLVFLERQFSSRPAMQQTVRIGIQRAQAQAEHFGVLHENVLANLGDLYLNTISTIEPRIMVNGEQQHLSNPNVVNKIRALLLAGIRSALLWRQCGGTRWKFLLFRKKLQDEIQRLLVQLES